MASEGAIGVVCVFRGCERVVVGGRGRGSFEEGTRTEQGEKQSIEKRKTSRHFAPSFSASPGAVFFSESHATASTMCILPLSPFIAEAHRRNRSAARSAKVIVGRRRRRCCHHRRRPKASDGDMSESLPPGLFLMFRESIAIRKCF